LTFTQNQIFLINQLEAAALIDDRYKELKCVSEYNGHKRGNFSLVFQAFDTVENKFVALKFMDPEHLTDAYRLEAFKREPKILQSLFGKSRCLRLVSGLKQFTLSIALPPANGNPQKFNLHIDYFAIEWLDDDLDIIFQTQESVEAIAKLELFVDIVLAVEVLHTNNVCHRDIKVDNLRLRQDEEKEVVVAIDFGTAARAGMGHLQAIYDQPVGHLYYSAPETYAGFAGDREIGKHSDAFALGCILYELFNKELFIFGQLKNPNYNVARCVLALACQGGKNFDDRLRLWQAKIPQLHYMVEPAAIDGAGSSVPPGIRNQVDAVYRDLVKFDFCLRDINLSNIRQRIFGAIKALRNERLQRFAINKRKQLRQKRQEKVRIKQERLARYLT